MSGPIDQWSFRYEGLAMTEQAIKALERKVQERVLAELGETVLPSHVFDSLDCEVILEPTATQDQWVESMSRQILIRIGVAVRDRARSQRASQPETVAAEPTAKG